MSGTSTFNEHRFRQLEKRAGQGQGLGQAHKQTLPRLGRPMNAAEEMVQSDKWGEIGFDMVEAGERSAAHHKQQYNAADYWTPEDEERIARRLGNR